MRRILVLASRAEEAEACTALGAICHELLTAADPVTHHTLVALATDAKQPAWLPAEDWRSATAEGGVPSLEPYATGQSITTQVISLLRKKPPTTAADPPNTGAPSTSTSTPSSSTPALSIDVIWHVSPGRSPDEALGVAAFAAIEHGRRIHAEVRCTILTSSSSGRDACGGGGDSGGGGGSGGEGGGGEGGEGRGFGLYESGRRTRPSVCAHGACEGGRACGSRVVHRSSPAVGRRPTADGPEVGPSAGG